MAVPKFKTSHAKKNMRRSHDFLTAPVNSICPNCKEVKRPHTICESCGHYKGHQVIAPKSQEQMGTQDFTAED